MRVLLLACLLGVAFSVDIKQLRGLKKLLTKLDSGIYPTCKIIFFSEMVDYDTADNNCKSFKMGTGVTEAGNLATVNDEEKNSDLKLLLHMAYPKDQSANPNGKWDPDKWVWAGLRKTKNNGYDGGFSKKYNPLDWSWSDGSNPTDFKKWFNKKQPDQAVLKKGKKGCNEDPKCLQNQMRINHAGKWDDTWKFKKHPYACDYQGKYILSATPRTWPKAAEACEDAGLHMAKVRSMAELNEITDAAKFFLGERDEDLKEFHSSNWFWIGGNDIAEEGVWRWEADGADGDPIDITWMPWRKPNPDDAQYMGKTGQDVMSISILGSFKSKKGKLIDRGGLFDDSFDKKRKRPFACQCPGT